MPDVQGLPRRSEQHFLVSDEAAEPYAVDPDAIDVGAARPWHLVHGGIGWRRQLGRRARGGDHAGRGRRRARRGVGFVGMVKLDDLHALIERGGLLGEVHHQHRAHGEVSGDDDPHPGLVG